MKQIYKILLCLSLIFECSISFATEGQFKNLCRMALGAIGFEMTLATNVDPASLGLLKNYTVWGSREIAPREIAVGDPGILRLWGDYEGHVGNRLKASTYKSAEKFTDNLMDAFGFTPTMFQHGDSSITKYGIEFRALNDVGLKMSELKPIISVYVRPSDATILFTLDSNEKNAWVVQKGDGLPKTKSYLKRLLTKYSLQKYAVNKYSVWSIIKHGEDPIFRWDHSITIPRADLQAFMIELDQFYSEMP